MKMSMREMLKERSKKKKKAVKPGEIENDTVETGEEEAPDAKKIAALKERFRK
jgi:hypothetical protein